MQGSNQFNLKKIAALGAFLLLAIGMISYGRQASGTGWEEVKRSRGANDFASYYYALNAAVEGENPYEKRVLGRLAKQEGRSGQVHPFFYPPPYLLTMAWAIPLELSSAHQVFYWAGSFFLIAVMLALWRWLPGLGVFAVSGLVLMSFTPIADTLRMGQANLMVLAMLVWGILLVEWEGANKRQWVGGALVGLACMMKMSPALLVLWWMVRRQWRPVIAAVAAGFVSSLLVLPLVGGGTQIYFYTDVLPSFTSGGYHGLTVPVNIPMNHSILNFWMQVTSGFEGMSRNTEATLLATNLARATSLSTLLCLFFLLRAPRPDPISRANAAGAFVVLMVLAPAFTYEHHLVFLIFPIIAASAALFSGRLHWRWAILLVAIYVVLAWNLQDFKAFSASMGDGRLWSGPAVAVRELKFLAVAALGCLCLFAAIKSHPGALSGDDENSSSRPRVTRRSPGEGDWL